MSVKMRMEGVMKDEGVIEINDDSKGSKRDEEVSNEEASSDSDS